ncbi:ROK family protein [Kitasatospora sp. NPDC002040]|uniref:ROK family protein n=1 Tax=Kitasatospora sp. NPDC002040 TaxID=3154661 RepID=UPI0033282B61
MRTDDAPVVIALEVGSARISGVAMAADGTLLHSGYRATDPGRGPEAVLETVLEYAADLARRYPPAAAGVAVPGLVDEAAGASLLTPHLGRRRLPLRGWLAEELGLPVAFVHDARAGGLAEARLGAGRGPGSFLYVPVGAGIGAAMVRDGQVRTGIEGLTGDLGHAPARSGDDPCPCGSRGCLATVASADAVVRRYRLRSGAGPVGPAEVRSRAERGDPAAVQVWHEAAEALAAELRPAVSFLAPDRVVVGGALARAGRTYLGALQAALSAGTAGAAAPRVVPGRLGRPAAVIGAALLAQRLHLSRQAAAGAVRRPGAVVRAD